MKYEEDLTGKQQLALVGSIIAVIVLVTQIGMFRLDENGTTATKGFISQDTINLEEYKKVGESNFRFSCWGGGSLYTRSAINETTFVCGKEKSVKD